MQSRAIKVEGSTVRLSWSVEPVAPVEQPRPSGFADARSHGLRQTGDALPAIRAAIAALKPGGRLWLPCGRFHLSGPLAIPAGITVRGSGPCTVLWAEGPGQRTRPIVFLKGTDAQHQLGNGAVESLHIEDRRTGSELIGVEVSFCRQCAVRAVSVHGTPGSAVLADTGSQNTFIDIDVSGAGTPGSGAFHLFRQSRAEVDTVRLFNLRPDAFGWQAHALEDSRVTNVFAHGGRQATGRGFKLQSSARNVLVNIVEYGFASNANFILNGGSTGNTLIHCGALANLGGGIATFGDGNHGNRFIGCRSAFNRGEQFYQAAGSDDRTRIERSFFCCSRGNPAALVTLQSNECELLSSEVFDDQGGATHGLGFGSAPQSNRRLRIIGNRFFGFRRGQAIHLRGTSVQESEFTGNDLPDGFTPGGRSNRGQVTP